MSKKGISDKMILFQNDQTNDLAKYKRKIQYGETPYEIILEFDEDKT